MIDTIDDEDCTICERLDTPFNTNAVELTPEKKIELIQPKVKEILEILGLDTNDSSLMKTPYRAAKMWVKELFYGLSIENEPSVSKFKKNYDYGEMIVSKNISIFSTCEHHLLPIIGKAHVAYFPKNNEVVGLSKINRIVDFYAKRPQVQERLTFQIVNKIKSVMQSEDVACVIEAKHLCVNYRGIRDANSSTVTNLFEGQFKQQTTKKEFLKSISLETEFG